MFRDDDVMMMMMMMMMMMNDKEHTSVQLTKYVPVRYLNSSSPVQTDATFVGQQLPLLLGVVVSVCTYSS